MDTVIGDWELRSFMAGDQEQRLRSVARRGGDDPHTTEAVCPGQSVDSAAGRS
jgi:hypothetical protein